MEDSGACNCGQSLELKQVIQDLLEWSEIMGGWNGACWERAREAIKIEDEQLGCKP